MTVRLREKISIKKLIPPGKKPFLKRDVNLYKSMNHVNPRCVQIIVIHYLSIFCIFHTKRFFYPMLLERHFFIIVGSVMPILLASTNEKSQLRAERTRPKKLSYSGFFSEMNPNNFKVKEYEFTFLKLQTLWDIYSNQRYMLHYSNKLKQ